MQLTLPDGMHLDKITPGRSSETLSCTVYSVPFFCFTHAPTIDRNESFSAEIGLPFIDSVPKWMPHSTIRCDRILSIRMSS